MRRLLPPVLFLLLMAIPAQALAAGAGSTQLVSRPDGLGAVAPALDNDSFTPGALSDDGRYAVYESTADGLAPGADPRVSNVYVRDRQANTTTLVSRSDGAGGAGADRDAGEPDVTVQADGHVLVVFESRAGNLADHDTGAVANPHNISQVWVRDVTAGTTTLISRANGASGAPANDDARRPAITDSTGGPLVVFDTQATNVGGNGVVLRTPLAGTTAQVSCPRGGCDLGVKSASTDPDVRVTATGVVVVAFASTERSVFDTPTQQIVRATAIAPLARGLHPTTFTCCNALSIGQSLANAPASKPAVSRDGQAFGFVSAATNLGGVVPAGVDQAWVRGISGPTLLLSRNPAGEPANSDVLSIALGGTVTSIQTLADLRAVFVTSASNFPGADTHAYLREVRGSTTSTTSVIDRASGPNGVLGNGTAENGVAISSDASVAMFATDSSNLGDGSVNRFDNVDVRRLTDPQQDVELMSRPSGTGPLAASDSDQSFVPTAGSAVSANGRYVVFVSQSDSLSPVDDNRLANVFVRDLRDGTTTLVNRATGARGVAADADNASVGGISADGRRVAFTSAARNLDPDANGTRQAYVRDLDAETTTLVSRPNGAAGTPAGTGASAQGISGDGNAVLFTAQTPLDRAVTGIAPHAYVRDVTDATTAVVDRDDGPDGAVGNFAAADPVISADGRHVAWASLAKLADAPADNKIHVYTRDLDAGRTVLVSRRDGEAGASADGTSLAPAIDAAGDVVAFTSDAPNLGAASNAQQIFVRDITRAHTELASRPVDGGVQLPTSARDPSIDAAGERIAFLAVGGIDTPPTANLGAYVRDLSDQTTTLASRADGAGGATADSNVTAASISGSGDCVAFSGRISNMGDGFGSPDFASVHLRTLRGECPAAEAAGPGDLPDGGEGTGGGGPGSGGPGTTPPPAAPVLSALKLSPKRFHVGGRKSGSTLRFKLSRAASVGIHVDRLTRGHRKGRRCVAGGRGKACTRVAAVGTLSVKGRDGANKVRFSGKLGRKALRPGRYQLTATPASGGARKISFTVVKR